jgi:ribonuclease HII
VAKANILKLLGFDEDVREAVVSGRRLRNCTLVRPPSPTNIAPQDLCFIGVEEISGSRGPVVAAAASICSLNWNQGLKNELERLNRGPRGAAEAMRNQLTETLLEQTVWAIGEVSQEQAAKAGSVRASQIAIIRAIDSVLIQLDTSLNGIIVLIDEQKTIDQLKHFQMAISNASDRSASVAAAFAVAKAYRERAIARTIAKRRTEVATKSGIENFAPPSPEEIAAFGMASPIMQVISR